MQLYMSWYIRLFFGFTFLNILFFSSTFVLTYSIDVSVILSINIKLAKLPSDYISRIIIKFSRGQWVKDRFIPTEAIHTCQTTTKTQQSAYRGHNPWYPSNVWPTLAQRGADRIYVEQPGPWFNIKMSSYQYRKSHCGDKTVVRPSYLHNGISYTGKMSSLYWIGALGPAKFAVRDVLYDDGFTVTDQMFLWIISSTIYIVTKSKDNWKICLVMRYSSPFYLMR